MTGRGNARKKERERECEKEREGDGGRSHPWDHIGSEFFQGVFIGVQTIVQC